MSAKTIEIIIGLIIILIIALAQGGRITLIGHNGINSFISFNKHLDYHRANLDKDYHLMQSLAMEILEFNGEGDALEFAAYEAGYSNSAKSHYRTKKEALQWAYAGLDWLEETHRLRDQPWSGIQLQAYIAFDRILNERKMKGVNHLVRQKCALWLATGGGPRHISPLTSQSYRDYLGQPEEKRESWILNRMSRF
jgi:hypothetical protein